MEPLPPVKEVEYRCIIGRLFEELSGQEFITFAFETAKEFSSFRYEIAVRYRIQPGALEFKVLGMTATRTMMPAHGTARSVLKLPLLPIGIYNVKMIKSDGTENIFVIEVTKRGIQVVPPVPRKRFLDLVVDDSAAAPGAKILSTVSKTPPVPLVPRTIQKRQPPPPTPEELALLESLKSETPEERDAREELELFGGKKKVDKKELEDVEQDLKTLDAGAPINADLKSSAKSPVQEIMEVPANALPGEKKGKAEPARHEAQKHDAPKHDAPKHDAPKHAPAKPDAHKVEASKHTAKAEAKPMQMQSKQTAQTGTKPTPAKQAPVAPMKGNAKTATAKSAAKDSKPAAKPDVKSSKPQAKTESKQKVEVKSAKTKTAHTTVSKQASKPASKSAPPQKSAPAKGAAKKPAVKSAPARPGSAKTNKSAAPKKGAKKK